MRNLAGETELDDDTEGSDTSTIPSRFNHHSYDETEKMKSLKCSHTALGKECHQPNAYVAQ